MTNRPLIRPPRFLAPFGANVGPFRLQETLSSPHLVNGRFRNPVRTGLSRPGDMGRIIRQWIAGREVRVPKNPVPIVRRNRSDYEFPPESGLRVTWMGHASTLLEIDGKRVLTDPVWSNRCSPFQTIGPKRFHPPPIALRELPKLDVVIVSHDHYDHLDYNSIRALAKLDVPFVVPLGVGAHLRIWGVPQQRITELDWHDATTVNGLRITALPARHFSGRWIRDRNATQWASFSILGDTHRVFYSGDSGYFDGYKEIGTHYGPFDLALIAIGAYAEEWPDVHLNPEEAFAAYQEVRAKVLVPVHWGTFQLALHSWFEPANRLLTAMRGSEATDPIIAIPRPGQFVEPASPPAIEPWWRQ